jgi:50S ribosomal subunit-associated GTPase HflX
MGAVMAELSKTAKASMVKEVKQVKAETPEESLRQLRLNLDAGLFITTDRIRVLLSAYDRAESKVAELQNQLAEATYAITHLHDLADESGEIDA